MFVSELETGVLTSRSVKTSIQRNNIRLNFDNTKWYISDILGIGIGLSRPTASYFCTVAIRFVRQRLTFPGLPISIEHRRRSAFTHRLLMYRTIKHERINITQIMLIRRKLDRKKNSIKLIFLIHTSSLGTIDLHQSLKANNSKSEQGQTPKSFFFQEFSSNAIFTTE